MGIIYFDICAIPLFLMILLVCFSLKMTKGRANQLFILVVLCSLFSVITDLGMAVTSNMVPLSPLGLTICNVSTYLYLALRNANNLILLLYLLTLTRTTFLLRETWKKVVYFLPYAFLLFLLVQNLFTHNVFTVTAEEGYKRGPYIMGFYGVAMLYGLAGLIYCIYCRRYFTVNKWASLLSIYILAHIAVVIQFFYPQLLVEMFFTAVGEMFIMLLIMRPEERMDAEVGMLSWASYQSDLHNICLSGERVQIAVIQIPNSQELRNYLGDHEYNKYIIEIANEIRSLNWNHLHDVELYYERPGVIYLITDVDETGTELIVDRLLTESSDRIISYENMGLRFDPRVCLIRCPEDLNKVEDIISLGHKFPKIDNHRHTVYASDLVHSRNFSVEVHIEEILDRAIKDNHIKMYYQPIYDVGTGSFDSAEALARIVDPELGMISPAIFIPAAETQGLIIPIGDAVLEQVFQFISENNLDELGISHIGINLSVAQCMENSLPEKIRTLQKQYNIDPRKVHLEITETTFENISDTMVKNVDKLIQMGYNFVLDDYGIGYSNIQRVNNIPLKLVKIDKSMLTSASSPNGRVILEYTVHMMQRIGKQIVAEGAETIDEVGILKNMHCDYIQGFYFSRPLPPDEFIQYVREQNQVTIG